MTVQERIQRIRLLELMQKHERFSAEAGLTNASTFKGENVKAETVIKANG